MTETTSVKIVHRIIPDDGEDGMFFRGGERWLRDNGKEYRLMDLAPNLETWWKMEKLISNDLENQIIREQTDDK